MTTKLLWLAIIVTVLTFFSGFFLETIGITPSSGVYSLMLLLPVATLLIHSSIVFSPKMGALLFLLPAITGLLFEIVGVKHGTVFGGQYSYNNQQFGLMLFNVPLLVPIYWTVFIYTGYSITTSLLTWVNKNKPSIGSNNFILVPLLVFLDGLTVVAIDIFMDPLMVYEKKWIWHNGGSYFNIPIGNFIGWFLVTIIATGIFRSIEYLYPQKNKPFNKSVYLVPILGYFSIWLLFLIASLSINLPQLALIGTIAMLPILIVNVIFFIIWKFSLKST